MNNIEPFNLKWSHENPTGRGGVYRFVATMMHLCDSSTRRGRARFPEITQSLTLQRGMRSITGALVLFLLPGLCKV